MGNDMTVAQLKEQAKTQDHKERSCSFDDFNRVIDDIKSQQKITTQVNVERSRLFRIALFHLKEKGSEHARLDIRFSTDGTAETVVNLGGPNREFFSLLFAEFSKGTKEANIFESKGGFLLPVNDRAAIDEGMFSYFGKAVVLSICSDAGGFPYFPPFVVSYIRDREFRHELSTAFVINTYLVEYIEKIVAVNTMEELNKVIGEDTERFMETSGWSRSEKVTLQNRLHYVQMLLEWELVYKRRDALNQIKEGLNCLSFLDKTKDFADFVKLLECRDKQVATANYIKQQLRPKIEQLKSDNEVEEMTKKVTLECLRDLNDEEASQLFQFITGMDDIPIHDFLLRVDFNTSDPKEVLPKATTCLQILHLPLGNQSKVQFYSSFNKALTLGRLGFAE